MFVVQQNQVDGFRWMFLFCASGTSLDWARFRLALLPTKLGVGNNGMCANNVATTIYIHNCCVHKGSVPAMAVAFLTLPSTFGSGAQGARMHCRFSRAALKSSNVYTCSQVQNRFKTPTCMTDDVIFRITAASICNSNKQRMVCSEKDE